MNCYSDCWYFSWWFGWRCCFYLLALCWSQSV